MNLNKVFLIGRLTSDPQLKTTMSGQMVTTFSLATNRVWINKQGQRQEDTQFHNIVVWGRQAEIASQFLKKGTMVFIEGRIQSRSWQDNQGQNRRVFEIVAERLQLGPRARTESISEEINAIKEEKIEESFPEINLEEEEIKPEDIPF